MDALHFDTLARSLAEMTPRRQLLRGLAAAFGVRAIGIRAGANAKKKPKKAKPNAFGCLDVGKPCRGKNAKCCSGICQGKRPKKGKRDRSRCVAHNVGECSPGRDFCQGTGGTCGTGGACMQTTGKASFCGTGIICQECQRDSDCIGFLVGADEVACIVCAPPECPPQFTTACALAAA